MRRMDAVTRIVLGVCLLAVAAGAAAQTAPVPLTPAAQRTADGLVARPAAETLSAEAPPVPDGYSDGLCTSPQNLTGLVLLGTNYNETTNAPDLVWDGAAYGAAFIDASMNVKFVRVAADGTLLTAPVTVDGSSVSCHTVTLAWSGSEYGLAWYDARNSNNEIYFARVSSAGALISGSELRVTNDTASSMYPSLVWRGTEWGVAWQDYRTTVCDIYYARISAAGAKVGSDLQITSDAGSSYYPSLAWDGSYCGVAWQDNRTTTYDIYFVRIDTTGKVGTDLQVTSNAGSSLNPSLAWNGSSYAVVWHEDRGATGYDIYLRRLSSAGTTLGSEVQLTDDGGYSAYASIAWTGSEYGVAWDDERDGYDNVYFARVSSYGAKVGSDVRLSADASSAERPRIAFGTLGYGLTFLDTITDRAHFVGVGCRSDSTLPLCPTGLLATANSGTGISLRWVSGVDYETELAYHRVYRDSLLIATVVGTAYTDAPRPAGAVTYTVTAVNANGRESAGCASLTVEPPEGECGTPQSGPSPVTQSTSASTPSIAWTGNEYGIAWSDFRDGNFEIYFARMAADGTKLGADVKVSASGSSAYGPSLVWTGTQYGVSWTDNRDGNYEIYFARLNASGVKQGADVRITNDAENSVAQESGSLAWSGNEYGVAWTDDRDGNTEVYFARISSAGVKLGADLRVTSDANSSDYPKIAWSGSGYGVVWEDNRDGNYEVYFARISSAGVKQGADVRLTSATGLSVSPSVTWGGGEWGVAWYDARDAGGYETYFTRVNTSGAEVGADVRLTYATGSSLYPDLAWTGSEYAIAWYENRDGGNTEIYFGTFAYDGSGYTERRLTSDALIDEGVTLSAGNHGLGVAYRTDTSPDGIFFQRLGCGADDGTPPSCPASPVETARTSTTVTLSWGPSVDNESDLGAYRVYRDGVLLGATTATTWTDSAFDPAAGYLYLITGTNAAGLESAASASVDTSDSVPPSCAGALFGSRSGETITLNWAPAWDAKSGVKEYRVYRNGVLAGTVAAPTTTFGETPAAGGYAYTVETVDWAGNYTAACPTYWVTTSPILLFVTKNGDTVNADLDWNDAGLPEYVVYRSTDPRGVNALTTVPESAAKDAVLRDGVTLWFYFIQQRE